MHDAHAAILNPQAAAAQEAPPADRPLKVIRPASLSVSTVVAGISTLVRQYDLLYTLTLFRLNIRYKQSALGWLWAGLQPVALMTIYTLIFSRFAKVSSEGIPYPLFVFSALLPWIFFSSAITNAVHGLVSYPALLTKMYFPREIIPLSYVAAALVDLAISLSILACLMLYYRTPLSWNALYAVPILAALCIFTTAVALVLSSIQVRFRDIGVALPLLLQVWMFGTPIVYSMAAVPVRYRYAFLLNPVATFIASFREVLVHGLAPDKTTLAAATVISILCLTAAYAYFKSAESNMADSV
ncbi:MAG: ABC transporter permease [Acidobacteriaceae bacterium]